MTHTYGNYTKKASSLQFITRSLKISVNDRPLFRLGMALGTSPEPGGRFTP
jgi:hypothetical protein